MPRLIPARVALVATVLSLTSCGRNEPAWTDLPAPSEVPFTVSLRTYGGGHADRPFDLRVSSKTAAGMESTVVRSSQCKNVRVLPRRDYIYIFYDELGLSGYSSFQYDASLPRPFLCDLRNRFCSELLQAAVSAKERVSSACSYLG